MMFIVYAAQRKQNLMSLDAIYGMPKYSKIRLPRPISCMEGDYL